MTSLHCIMGNFQWYIICKLVWNFHKKFSSVSFLQSSHSIKPYTLPSDCHTFSLTCANLSLLSYSWTGCEQRDTSNCENNNGKFLCLYIETVILHHSACWQKHPDCHYEQGADLLMRKAMLLILCRHHDKKDWKLQSWWCIFYGIGDLPYSNGSRVHTNQH